MTLEERVRALEERIAAVEHDNGPSLTHRQADTLMRENYAGPVSQEKDDLESRFSGLPWYWESASEKIDIVINKPELLDFIREEGDRRYREGALLADKRNYREAKQAGRKETAQEAVSLFEDEFASVLSVLEIREILKAYFSL